MTPQTDTRVQEAARDYIARSWSPVPIAPRSKRPPESLPGWPNLRIRPDEVPEYFANPSFGIGVLLGPASGELVDVDIDCMVAGTIASKFLPPTAARFGRHSKPRSHWLYVSPGATTRKHIDPCPPAGAGGMIVELRGEGHQTVFPPSTHVEGEIICWDSESPQPHLIDADKLAGQVGTLAAAALLARHFPPKGSRDEAALALSGVLLQGGFSVEHAQRFIEIVATAAGCDDVPAKTNKPRSVAKSMARGKHVAALTRLKKLVDPRVVAAVVDWLRLSLSSAGESTRCTDAANGERFADAWMDELLFCKPWNKWLGWDGMRWALDESASVRMKAVTTAKGIYDEAKSATGQEQKEIAKWATTSQQQGRLSAMLWLGESHLPVLPQELDEDRHLLNVRNGTLDLRTCELHPHSRAHRLTKLADVEYDERSSAPQWEAFLDTITSGDDDLRRFLQRACGYSLTGSIEEQCLFLLHGSGANGKTTFIEVIRRTLGDYARPTDFRTLMQRKNNDTVRNDVAALRGLRMVSAGEPNRGQKLDEALLKLMTGGDRLSARHLYGEFFDFDPTFKIWLAANHRPRIDGTDDGIWRRLHLIDFTTQIPENARIPNMTEKLLREEASGILNWMVKGCLDWQVTGLQLPAKVIGATRAYRNENDSIGLFLVECCDVDDPESDRSRTSHFTAVRNLRKVYEDWCTDASESPISARDFSDGLQERGLIRDHRYHDGKMRRGYIGVRLKGDDPF